MSFEKCYDLVMKFEGRGKLTNSENDRGKETFSGISRKHWPEWEGWDYIEGMRKHENFPVVLQEDEVLDQLVRSFYKKNFFDRVGGDLLPEKLGVELFEMSVNCGVLPSLCILQEALNLLNCNQKYWPDAKIDGAFGKETKRCLLECLNHPRRGEGILCLLVNRLQAERYIIICRKDKSQEEFLVGWLKRS